MKPHDLARQILATSIAAVLLTVTPVLAATSTWTGAPPSASNDWSNLFNWSGGVPANNGTADLIFGTTPRPNPNLTSAWSVLSVTFNNTAPAYILSSAGGFTLTVGAGGITNSDPDTQTINHPIALSAPQTWTASAGNLEVYGAINLGGQALTIDGAALTYLGSAISGGGSLNKSGTQTLILTGAATYSGTTNVNAGRLHLNLFANANGIGGTINVGDGLAADLDFLQNNTSHQIADSATVNVSATGVWELNGSRETITTLSVSSSALNAGAVNIGGQVLELLGNLTMTGGTVTTTGLGGLRLNGDLTTNAASAAARIAGTFELANGTRTFTTAKGSGSIDLDVTGIISLGGIIKNGAGTLRLTAPNSYSGGTTLNAGKILIGRDSALGTGPLTGNGGTIEADGSPRAISNALSGNLTVDGAYDLTLNAAANVAGNITKIGSGALIFAQPGTFDGLTLNGGTARFDAALTFTNGLTNSATLVLGTQPLTAGGTGLDNRSSLPIAGGSITINGAVVNNGLIAGNGTLGGSGDFTNNAQLTVSGGNFTLAKAGTNTNAGNIAVGTGLQLRLSGGTLTNTGTIALAGGIVGSTAQLTNNAGGTVSGWGTISTPFVNAGGTLRALGGTLNVTSAFTSSGIIRLDDAAAVSGGAITNTGRILGDGTILNALTNVAGGTIRVDAGDTLFFRGGFAANAGELNLQGGTLDFTAAITNSATGFIAGRGALYTGGLTNSGQLAFSGGTMDLHGDVTLVAGSRVVTSGAGSVTTFFDDVTHNGTEIFTGAGASTVIFGGLTGAGNFTGTGTVYSIGDLRPGNSPATVSYGGDLVFAPSTTLTLELGGLALGTQYDHLTVNGTFFRDGVLQISLFGGYQPQLGNRFDLFDSGTTVGTFDSVQLPALNNGLSWNTAPLATTGEIAVVPEPATALLLGLGALIVARRRR